MKILVFSDSHGNLCDMINIIEDEKPSIIVTAGDCLEDTLELPFIYKENNYKFYSVKGNCDYYLRNYENSLVFEIAEKRIMVTHGHEYRVKSTMELLEKEAKKSKFDIIIFGHTHKPYFLEKDKVYYFNPGAINDKKYGIIEICDGEFKFIHKNI